jgi:hypothetical protein
MARVLAVSFVFLALSLPSLGAGMTDLATVTCKDWATSGHQDMVKLDAAFYQAAKGNPNLSSLSEQEFGRKLEQTCAENPKTKVFDALGITK